MNTTEFIRKIYEDNPDEFTSLAHTERCLKAVIAASGEVLEDEGELKLFGLGSFKVKQRPEHSCVNPQTGEKMKVEATNYVKFSAASVLKDSIQ